MLADITEIVFEDGGDGSTYVTLKFENQTELHLNPDIPFEGRVIYTEDDGFAEGRAWDESGQEL